MTLSSGSRASTAAPVKMAEVKPEPSSEDEDADGAGPQGDIQPVGHDYVEEVRLTNLACNLSRPVVT